MKRLIHSFKFAIAGVKYVWKTQHNMKIHFLVGTMVILAGIFFHLKVYEWLAIVIVIGFVLILEVINTAIETLVDLYTEEYNQLARISKDTAAGAVMLMACVSVVVGIIIFGPKIWALVEGLFV